MPAFTMSKCAKIILHKAEVLGLSTAAAHDAHGDGRVDKFNAEMSRLARLVEEHETESKSKKG